MHSFSELDLFTSKTIVGNAKPEYFEENHDFYKGDHWRKGDGFSDPVPPPANAISTTVVKGIQRIFVAANHVRECTKRRTDGVLARAPKWEFVRRVSNKERSESNSETHEDLALPDITLPMRTWWEMRDVHTVIKDAITEASLSDDAVLRIYIPPGRLSEGQTLDVDTPEEALEHIYVDVLSLEQATVYTDRWSMREVGIALFAGPKYGDPVPENGQRALVSDYAEVTYVTKEGMTVHRLVFSDGREAQQASYDLGGRMLMINVGKILLITEQIRALQRAINTTLTHMALNNRETNFQQRIYLNAQPPGTIEVDKETGQITVKVEQFERGADTDQFIKGVEVEHIDGDVEVLTPDLKVINPTDPRGYTETIAEYRRNLYREGKQLHIELIKDATSTGEARQQAVADFTQDLVDVKKVADKVGKWILETVWAMAVQLATGKVIDDDIKAQFDSLITIGPIANDLRRILVEENKAGLKSRLTAISESGVENPEEEMRRIADDIEYKLLIAELRAKAIGAFTNAGVDLESAARLIGMNEEEIKVLIQVDTDRLELFQTNGQQNDGDEEDSEEEGEVVGADQEAA